MLVKLGLAALLGAVAGALVATVGSWPGDASALSTFAARATVRVETAWEPVLPLRR